MVWRSRPTMLLRFHNGEFQEMGEQAEPDVQIGDVFYESQLNDYCWQMLEHAAKTRQPGDQVMVGMKSCQLAAVIHFIEPGTGEEYADWLELLEVRKAHAESAGQRGIPLEQIVAELALEIESE